MDRDLTARLAEWSAPDTAEIPERLVGQVMPREGLWLRRAARLVQPGKVIVEIGSYTGKSTACLAVGSAEGFGVPVHAVDLWTMGTSHKGGAFRAFDAASGEAQSTSKFHHPEVREKFTRRMAQYDRARLVVPHMGESTAVARRWTGGPIGLLFIDGEHTYDGVRRDFQAWARYVDGTVAFHDYGQKKNPELLGVRQFVDQLKGWQVVRLLESMAIVERTA